jgi:hypothetical protein
MWNMSGCKETELIVAHAETTHHLFHKICLIEWTKVQNSCPLCRREITMIDGDAVRSCEKAKKTQDLFVCLFVPAAIIIPCLIGTRFYKSGTKENNFYKTIAGLTIVCVGPQIGITSLRAFARNFI